MEREEGTLHFAVIDEGIGMSPKVLERLFLPFEQAENTISRRFGGTGLGLHISKILAELMGGTLEVSSVERRGSRFELILPYVEGVKEALASQSREALPLQLKGHVLIAEDTPELQLLERRILESIGLTVEIAVNGREAIEKWSGNTFDLILMDMQMPEMDGIEATSKLREMGCKIPIVALTANVMEKHRKQFGEAGGSGFLEKPIDRQVLIERLQQELGQASKIIRG
ncbi:MAG: response regulator [Gammaproteobacteria bacterium]|nr:response regulator [Gammaproteobacteria bacterium]MBT3490196.1 response regulator [Gammaproteobacteria bacterium]MBT3718741.1 response regulator [Gammaproteobacteria bacterium]MBT3845766.1 response regulator [Gammaproteobacteria bacterium]MBT3892048.1 response regulator [Gammaproteobacteria bacterium]